MGSFPASFYMFIGLAIGYVGFLASTLLNRPSYIQKGILCRISDGPEEGKYVAISLGHPRVVLHLIEEESGDDLRGPLPK